MKLHSKHVETVGILLTKQCNWTCEYCIAKNFNIDKTIDQILQEIEDLPDHITKITLSGGEPGMLNRKDIEKIIEKAKNKNLEMNLLTNGLFIEKYPDLINEFIEIDYHCSQDLTEDIQFMNLEKNYPNVRFHYLIVVSNKNIINLDSFLEKYPDIIFNIMAAKLYDELTIKQILEITKKHKNQMTHECIVENLTKDPCIVI